jgi:FKBP-type peptidyl-prolyl cis-trans isomerase
MRYRGTLADGSVFDSNDKAGDKPFTFVLGAGTVIKGWDQGLVGMKKGGERKLSIPASLGYGSRAMSKIPANSDLYFTVMLDDMVRKEDMDTVVVSDVKVGTGPSVKKGDTIVIDYVCTLTDGTKVDSTLDSKKPYRFKVGAGDVWQGIDAGVVGMKLGGERKLQIPFELGPKLPGIPPGSVTHYDVFLREIKH